jgi:hypothetical protein
MREGEHRGVSRLQRAAEIVGLGIGSILLAAGSAGVAEAVHHIRTDAPDTTMPAIPSGDVDTRTAAVDAFEAIPDADEFYGGLAIGSLGLFVFAKGANLRHRRKLLRQS